MYRAFFVDDEPLVLESFMNKPIFLECGFIKIGHNTNPINAVDGLPRAKQNHRVPARKPLAKTHIGIHRQKI